MVALGGDGRNLLGLLAGSAVTAALGLLCVELADPGARG
jgi:manganese/zinc/iron transport system permease protein